MKYDTNLGSVLKEKEEMTALILQKNTLFKWDHPKADWGGMNKTQLTELVGKIGVLFKITPGQARLIEPIFGDHIVVTFPDNSKCKKTAMCLVDFNEDESVKSCKVIFNRSLELVDGASGVEEDGLGCVFETPYENIIWLIAEELKHAQIFQKAGSRSRESKWENNYKQVLIKKGIVSGDAYLTDIQEVTVSRNALEVLKELVPQRVDYFQKLYNESVRTFRHVSPNISRVREMTYLKTGFKF